MTAIRWPLIVLRNGRYACFAFRPIPMTGKPIALRALRASRGARTRRSPSRGCSPSTRRRRRRHGGPRRLLGGARKTNSFEAGVPPFVTAVSRFTTARSARRSTGAIEAMTSAGFDCELCAERCPRSGRRRRTRERLVPSARLRGRRRRSRAETRCRPRRRAATAPAAARARRAASFAIRGTRRGRGRRQVRRSR